MKRLLPLFLPVILLVAASCSPGTEGIFASIEREQKVQSLGGMNKYATITSMAELTSVTPHVYFATGGQSLFTRNYGAVQWDKMTVGGNANTTAVGSVGTSVSGERIFAIAGGSLWYCDASTGGTWVSAAAFNSSLNGDIPANLVPIRSTDGWTSSELLLVTYQLYSGGSGDQPNYAHVYRIQYGGATFAGSQLSSSVDISAQITPPEAGVKTLSSDVSAAVTNGSAYYLVNQNYLWTVDSSFASTILVTPDFSATKKSVHNYQGLLFTGSTLYLTTMSNAGTGGSLYASTSTVTGSSVTSISFDFATSGTDEVSLNASPVWFAQLLYNTRNASIWAATYSTTYYQGSGYMEYQSGAFNKTPITSTNNYNSTVLPTSAVGVLFADHESSPNYFLGTLSQGLWQWSGSGSTATWIQQ